LRRSGLAGAAIGARDGEGHRPDGGRGQIERPAPREDQLRFGMAGGQAIGAMSVIAAAAKKNPRRKVM
jgi:hypothetical protein